MKKEYLEAGKIVTLHGIKGELKIMPLCDSAELFCEFERFFLGKNYEEIFVERSRVQKNMAIVKLEGIDTPEAAEKLRGKFLYMHRDDLELDENTYFIQDLIGVEVRNVDTNELYGTIEDVLQTGANDVYSIKGENRDYLVPAIADVVISTDIGVNLMLIRPLEGLFDED